MIERDSTQLTLPVVDLALPQEGQLPRWQRIYCNRNLRFDQIAMVGFDLDYTLALYRQPEIDRLSIEMTARKLVERGYPPSLLHMEAPTNLAIRGLLVDRKLGNILKTDRYNYVKKVLHGTRQLGDEERRRLYRNKSVRPGTKRYYSIDTLYALSEVSVFAAAVDELDGGKTALDYAKLFDSIRASIDAAHRDGSIKNEITTNLDRYVLRDPDLAPMLHKLRSAGKKTFLHTNSDPAYTDALMSHLIGDALPEYPSWRHYFDVIVTRANKPRFFTESIPFTQIDSGDEKAKVTEFLRGRIYAGGCIREFERLTGFSGDRIVYVGDHIYGDLLRAKKKSAWRTVMIIQELQAELAAMESCQADIERMDVLDRRRYFFLDGSRDRRALLKSVQRRLERDDLSEQHRVELETARLRLRRSIDRIRLQSRAVEEEFARIEQRVDQTFHPFWGSFFKAGSELSSFGEQVERYACLYTARATNLVNYSPEHYFRGPRYRMAHE